ncbi:MAG TPA: phosphoglycerate kinase [Desulfatiglandales bacterium]|nr:phosphoglycerate kinase [Desulfatiglandales bacterium]
MPKREKKPRLKLIQDVDLNDKVVLIRVDHNVVKQGKINDPSRIDSSLGTLFHVVSRGGKPILMTHIGRPRDKKTGKINCSPDKSVDPVVSYLEKKLRITIEKPSFNIKPGLGITTIDSSIWESIQRLKERKIGAVYLPNIRWFQGEQAGEPERTKFAKDLSSLADIFVNDAFGSWQAHVSTFDITKYLPSCAGFLLQQEIKNLEKVLNPARPLLAIVAGNKYDTKIGPLKELYHRVDRLILGGVMYNTFLCAKYGIHIKGVTQENINLATELVQLDKEKGKIVELPFLVEAEEPTDRNKEKTKTISAENLRKGKRYKYILDADPASFHEKHILDIICSAKTILVNAVMGLTPYFTDGSKALYEAINQNGKALRLYGGGDTIQELKDLCPGLYMKCLESPRCYYFTGGGTMLKALEVGSPFKIKPVEMLLKK